ncbi:MAG: putative Inosine-uridine preferring nucleoside hydrolase [Promethearchaeota archaeon]|nr:MAG: putative Inosine-uridine preferring nucleoside hydrolase [Candidatus Lokiarchaeota archaeon]
MKKVIIDTDNTMGMNFRWNDDGLAILYSLGEEEIEIIGITTVFGNSSIKNVHNQTKRLLKSVNKTKIPLLKGASEKGEINTAAAEFLVDQVNSNRGEITIFGLGPLTNLYAAQKIDPDFFEKVREIILMGGIIDERLTIGRTKIKDVNLRNDLSAALEVLNAKCPVTIINCHICKQVPLTKEYLKQLDFWPDIYIDKLENEFWLHEKVHKLDHIYIWDVLVPMYLTHSEIFDDNDVYIKASNVEDLQEGRLVESEKAGAAVNMPQNIIDKNKFYNIIIKTWKDLDKKVRETQQGYINFKNGKVGKSIMKSIFSLMIPIFLRLMYEKQGEYYYEK